MPFDSGQRCGTHLPQPYICVPSSSIASSCVAQSTFFSDAGTCRVGRGRASRLADYDTHQTLVAPHHVVDVDAVLGDRVGVGLNLPRPPGVGPTPTHGRADPCDLRARTCFCRNCMSLRRLSSSMALTLSPQKITSGSFGFAPAPLISVDVASATSSRISSLRFLHSSSSFFASSSRLGT